MATNYKFRNATIRFTIRKPSKTRKTFKLVKDEIKADGTRSQTVIKDERLDKLNNNFKNDLIDINFALSQVEEIRKDYYEKHSTGQSDKLEINKSNMRFFHQFFEEEYRDRPVKSITEKSAHNEIKQAIMCLGEVSLLTGKKKDFLREIEKNAKHKAIETRRRYRLRLNQVLEWMNRRDVKLPKGKPEYKKIVHIDESQIKLLEAELESQFDKDALYILFYMGLREGELFAMNENYYQKTLNKYFVQNQLDREGIIDSPKAQKTRSVIVFKQTEEALERWFDYTDEYKFKSRETLSRRIKSASRRAFENKENHVSNHALRHSFAIHCLKLGMSLTDVAFLLGNSLKVAQQHYTGFTLQDSQLDILNEKFNR
jgi:integrase